MSDTPTVLLVEDDPSHAELASRSLEGMRGAPTLHVVESVRAAHVWLRANPADLVVADLKLPDGSGLDLLEHGVPLVVLTSQGDEAQAVAAMKGGAIDYLVKSVELYQDLPTSLLRALRAARAVNERNQAEASLRESEARFRQLAETIQEAFWLYDVDRRQIVYSSPAFRRVYGLPEHGDDLVGLRADAVHPEDQGRAALALRFDAPLSPTDLEFRVVAGGHGVRWLNERTFPIHDAAGRLVRVAGLGTDVTRRHELELALRQSQKLEAVGQLAGGVAHDFNNMLTAILSAAEELDRISESPQAHDLCAMVISASERAAELTRNLLAFSRKGRIRTTVVDLHELVNQTVALLCRSVDPRVRVVTSLVAGPAAVKGDAAQLQSALLNIGLNARDAMPNGGRITYSSAFVALDEALCEALPFDVRPGPFVRISIEDTGMGIAPESLSRIFEPFFTLKEIGKGTGLGLAAVYGTAIEHRGAIVPYSDVGRGTVFHLYIPLADEAIAPATPSGQAPEGNGRVLLVDDEPLVRAVGEQVLQTLGYTVTTAGDGLDAVERFSTASGELVAVVCDLMMPRMDGKEALRRMRLLRPDVPLILCSGFPGDSDPSEKPDFDAFLVKPYSRLDLASTLARLIAAR